METGDERFNFHPNHDQFRLVFKVLFEGTLKNTMDEEELKTLMDIKLTAVFERLSLFNWNRTHTAKSLKISVRQVRYFIDMLEEDAVYVPARNYKRPKGIPNKRPGGIGYASD